MKVFDQAKAAEAVTLGVGHSILTFCGIPCRIDWGNGVTCVMNRGLYGCWQCGEDMLQGLLVDKPMDDDNIYRRRREQR
ncbi:hypothetical protein LCGC14_0975600 [marine sediment metagenome]|uniref:Uncharacterized protein n=1 Tax=marine sediment metagenome TaxID=412755 RepID=A0A0F9QTK9_9ZZZZ